MSEIDLAALPEALRTALESRGFEGLTAVQAAVLEPENRGRDLRISSQTGSGKTVALGIAAFEAIQDALGLPLSPGGPSLLVIVPTRELASQVAEELGWLYAGLEGLRIDCVTGGTSVLAERRRLDHPPHVLVGTPGRLLDHLEAGALNLGEVAELVLDEADQMLDMGFRDELEGILERTPEERRTHLVSATLPAAILELAELYQRDAKAVEGTALGEANADIEHIAVRVVPQDRYAALTNLLLAAGDERTLVFVATRAGASQLADRLADDGFAALPLSGELAQAQRTRTLTAFRSGVARILVATDVAARGIDVPDVACVIQASVPLDAEVFTHRSGRTGRAGRKGRSIVLVTPRQERKARYQLRDVGVEADWRDAPDGEEVRAILRARRRARLEQVVAEAAEPDAQHLEEARVLLGERDPVHVLAAILTTVEEPSGPKPLEVEAQAGPRGSQPERAREQRPERPAPPASRGGAPGAFVPFQINWGFDGGATPKRILAHVCRRGDITGGDVGAIRIRPRSSTFELSGDVAEEFERRIATPDERDPQIRIRRAWAEAHDPREHKGGGRFTPRHDRGREGQHDGPRSFGGDRRGGSGFGGRGGRKPFDRGPQRERRPFERDRGDGPRHDRGRPGEGRPYGDRPYRERAQRDWNSGGGRPDDRGGPRFEHGRDQGRREGGGFPRRDDRPRDDRGRDERTGGGRTPFERRQGGRFRDR